MKVYQVFHGYLIFKNNDGFFEIGPKGNKETHLTGTSSKLIGALKFLILKEDWS